MQLIFRYDVLNGSLQDIGTDLFKVSIDFGISQGYVVRCVLDSDFPVASASARRESVPHILDAAENDSTSDIEKMIVNLVYLLKCIAVFARPDVHAKTVLHLILRKFDVDESQWVPHRLQGILART